MLLRQALARFRRRRECILKSRVLRALALHRRGEVRSDGLKLKAMSTTMRIEWFARDIHPWERGANPAHRDRLFVEQCLRDADATISRLFEEIPELDALEVRVFHHGSASPLMAGIVNKGDLMQPRREAPGMKLKTLGVTFKMSNWQLEPLQALDADSGSGA
jgi:hypothetical protein